MKLKKYADYSLATGSRLLSLSAGLMGLAFFLQAVHFFGFANIRQLSVAVIVFQLAVPMAVEAGWFVLLKGVRLNKLIVYSILGAVLCLLTMIQTMMAGAVLAAVVGVFLCFGGVLVLLAAAFGYLPSAKWGVYAYALVIVLRLLLGGLHAALPELAILLSLFSIQAFLAALTPKT